MEVFQPEAELTPDFPTRVMLIERSILLLLVVSLLISVFGIDMPLSLTVIGVFGGFIVFGVLGLFLGPTLLAIVYNLFTTWRAAVELHPATGSGAWETRTHLAGQQNSGRRVGGN
jgi:hypothetical protein